MRFSRRVPRIIPLLIAIAAACAPPLTPLAAQATARDSAAQRRAMVDSSRTDLRRYCKTNKPAGYLCPVDTLRLLRVSRAESVLVAPAPTPVPVPTPTPTPAPTPVDSSAPILPALLNTAMSSTPSNGRQITVTPASNLQTVLDSLKPGDRVTLACGIYTGNFVLNPQSGGLTDGWITLTTAAAPPEGVRASVASANCRPVLSSPNVTAALAFANGAQRWRIVGLEITTDSTVTQSNGQVLIGDGSATTTAQLPKNIILDRDYIHGTPAMWVHRCVTLNGDSLAVIDSYVSECHADIDAQAVWGWNANGPLKIVNNELQASTEVLGFGGADPAIAGAIPSDIEIRGNHITRPMSEKGGPWLVKNLIEIKAGRRVLIDGNVLENSWPNGQLGWAFVLWSVNQGGGCTWCETSHLTIRNNLIRNVASGFQMTDGYHDSGVPFVGMHDVSITNNVFIGLDAPDVAEGGLGVLIQKNLPNLRITHNTMFLPPTATSAFEWISSTPFTGNVVRDNLAGGGRYPFYIGPPGYTWSSVVGAGTSMSGNVFVAGDGLPAGNAFPASNDAIGFVGGFASAYDVGATLDQLALSAASPYKGKATDGTDPGANVAQIKAATANAVPATNASAKRTVTKPVRKP